MPLKVEIPMTKKSDGAKKHSHVYEADEPDAAVDSVYLRRAPFGSVQGDDKMPPKIKLTVEA